MLSYLYRALIRWGVIAEEDSSGSRDRKQRIEGRTMFTVECFGDAGQLAGTFRTETLSTAQIIVDAARRIGVKAHIRGFLY